MDEIRLFVPPAGSLEYMFSGAEFDVICAFGYHGRCNQLMEILTFVEISRL